MRRAAVASPPSAPTPTRPRPLLRPRPSHPRPLPTPPCTSAGGGFDGFLTLGSLLKPEAAALVSAAVALSSVGLNYYGSLATEQRRASLQAQLEDERSLRAQQAELQSIIGRYRGPLLESSVDLEQRLWHMATATGEWSGDPSAVCFEEVTYTLFTLAQFLGFLEIVRREGPRERSFLQLGSPHGGDTLATLLEGVKYALCASPVTLEAWLEEPDARRDHPGARSRTRRGGGVGGGGQARRSSGRRSSGAAGDDGDGDDAEDDGGGSANNNNGNGSNGNGHHALASSSHTPPSSSSSSSAASPGLRISRGIQRAIGASMTATPMGAERHYTLSYDDFVRRLRTDAEFASWFAPVERDLAALLTGPSWRGQKPGGHPWTRVLLLQQLLVDAVDLLDPDFVRVPPSRRLRLSPLRYAPLPNLDVFRLQLSALSTGIDPIISAALRQVGGGAGGGVGGAGSADAAGAALVAVAAAAAANTTSGGDGESRSLFLQWARGQKKGGAGSAAPPPASSHHFAALANLQAEWDGNVSGSGSSGDDDERAGGGGGGGLAAFGGRPGGGPILPAELLPDYGVTGVSLIDLKQEMSARQEQNEAGGVSVPGADAEQQWSLLTPLGELLSSVGRAAGDK